MDWARILAYVTGLVDQELLARSEYMAAENRILKAQLKGRLKLEPNQQDTIGPTQMRSTWRTLPKNVELMPQHQHLGLQLLSRLEAVAQHADE